MLDHLFNSEDLPGPNKPPAETTERPPMRFDLSLPDPRPIPLSEVCSWDENWQRMLFRNLLPVSILTKLGVDPITLCDADGRPVAHVIVGKSRSSVRLELYASADDTDATVEMELSDTPFNQIEFVWLALQDTRTTRYDIDFLPDGQLTMRGTVRRNLVAEVAAMAAGLAPGQIYKGFGLSVQLVSRLESFMAALCQRAIIAQPLFYHTAVLFEQLGFTYVQGQALMERIHKGFSPGGDLLARLDGSTAFRRPEMANSVRGRSWAVHDGILGSEWTRVRMIRRLGYSGTVNTCPGVPW